MQKSKVLSLIKTHINYLSLLILLLGFTLRYSLSNLFPILNKFDIRFFGGILIEFGLILLVGNWFIDKYKKEVNIKLFSNILDDKIGLKNTPLITELVNLIHPFSYNVIYHHINSEIRKNNTTSKYDVIQTLEIRIRPKQDNVYYSFGGISTSEEYKPRIEYIKLNDKIVLEDEIAPIKNIYGFDNASWKILKPLKKDKIYNLKIKIIYPSCMSDLNDGTEFDFHEYAYFALTERTKIKHKYNFPNFEKYNFRAEKRYMNLPDVTEVQCISNPKLKEITIEAANLKNGDQINLIYTKKK